MKKESQVFKPREVGNQIEQLYNDENETKEVTFFDSSPNTNSKNKYSMSGKNLHKTKKKSSPLFTVGWFWWVIGILLVASIILLISAFRFAGSPVGDGDVELTMSGPTEVGIGEEAIWTINYKNTSKVNFSKVQVNVRYPDGFKLTDS